MKTILENNDLLVAWLKTPAACRAALLERREQAMHINLNTTDGYHFINETRFYIYALIDAGIVSQAEGLLLYGVVTGVNENE